MAEGLAINEPSSLIRRWRPGSAAWTVGALLMFVAIMLVGSVLWSADPMEQDYTQILERPSRAHPLGTDVLGRDVLSRIFAGALTSLSVAGIVSLMSAVIGITLGILGGYVGGPVEMVINRIVDYFMTIPPFFLVLTTVALFGADMTTSAIIVGATLWPGVARIVRADVLTVKERDFVAAARVGGSPTSHILFFDVLPNAVQAGVVQCALNAARAVLIVAGLGFLGLNDPQSVDWGSMVSETLKTSSSAWWALICPGVAVMILVGLLNMLGDAISARDASSA